MLAGNSTIESFDTDSLLYVFQYAALGAHGAKSEGDACSANIFILRRLSSLLVLVRNRLATNLRSRDEKTKHEDNKDETLHVDDKRVSKLMCLCQSH